LLPVRRDAARVGDELIAQKWSLDLSATPPTATLTIDGAGSQSFPLLFGWEPDVPLYLQIGDLYNYRDQPAVAAFDNVVVDLH
jgi:hypothetical protein